MNVRYYLTSFVACAFLGAGCSGCGEGEGDDNSNNSAPDAAETDDGSDAGNNGTSADVDYLLIDLTEDDPAVPCPTINSDDGVLVALDTTDVIETFLAPDSAETELTIDYEVVPATVVERVVVDLDFDPRQMLEPLIYDERCPASVPVADLVAAADEEIVSGVVSATDAHGLNARRGRVTLSTGTATTTVLTDGLDETEAHGDWYFVFEPASGRTRILLAPADVTRTSYAQDGLPEATGAIGVILTDEVEWDAATRTAYAPPGFSSTWRQRASAWHGRLRRRGEDGDAVQRLQTMVPAGATVSSRPLAGEITQNFSTTTHLVLEATGDDATLSVPCDVLPLRIASAGFVELTVDELQVAAGETSTLSSDCTGTARVDFAVQSNLLVQRPQSVIVSREEAE